MKKNVIIITIIIITILGCKSSSTIVGNYYNHKQNSNLELFADSTFKYTYYDKEDIYKSSFGKWQQLKDNVILLNSDIQSNKPTIKTKIISSDKKHNPYSQVNLIVPNESDKDYKCYIYLDYGIPFPIDADPNRGSYTFDLSSSPVDIHFEIKKVINYRKSTRPKYPEKSLKSDVIHLMPMLGDSIQFDICFSDKLFFNKIFHNTEVMLGRNKLHFYDVISKIKTAQNIFYNQALDKQKKVKVKMSKK